MLFTLKFRKGVNFFLKIIKKDGHTFEIHTSRANSCDKDIKGCLIRKLTLFQFLINGVIISQSKIFFYKDDKTKIKGIIKSCPDLVFEDKLEIINSLSSINIKVICVKGLHNKKIEPNNNVQLINEFDIKEIKNAVESLFGALNLKYYIREAKSSLFFNRIKPLRPLIMIKFNPIVLHEDNICYDSSTGIIFAPNHRSTWDPIVITAILKMHIHWAALLRFFEAKDSIFNNRKNFILCKITSKAFKSLDYFPVERKKDNKNANNFNSIKDMNNYLKIKSKLGVFAEGTTKRPPENDFGVFDNSFIMMAQHNNSIIQPITVTWINNKKIKHKVIVNFAKPFL